MFSQGFEQVKVYLLYRADAVSHGISLCATIASVILELPAHTISQQALFFF